jgi:hypothetical protein
VVHRQFFIFGLKHARSNDAVQVHWSVFLLVFKQAFRELQGRSFKIVSCLDTVRVVFSRKLADIDWIQVLDVHISHLVLLALENVPESAQHIVIVLFTADHFGSDVCVLEDPIVTDHDRHNQQLVG